ncbi:MAG: hypothetical protein KJO43_00095, partial [Phycisphaerae bacterium]|nr:hypothetical protein [Phycisphaerae bacterium]
DTDAGAVTDPDTDAVTDADTDTDAGADADPDTDAAPPTDAYHVPMSPVATVPVAVRLGVVSFLNARPLIDGLETLADVSVRHSVPSRLIDQLLEDEVDVALCSSIDYQRSPEPLLALPAGLLGGDGATLTVRLFSQRPVGELESVYCDTDSHTSVALLRILLRERYDCDPAIVDYHVREHVAHHRPAGEPPAMLLIGDKVVTDAPDASRYPVQLDLGAEWASHTTLPFVYALWLVRATLDPERIALAQAVLDRQRRRNRDRIDPIVYRHATKWPAGVARSYLADHIAYDLTEDRHAGLELFYEKALAHGLIAARRPVRFWSEQT